MDYSDQELWSGDRLDDDNFSSEEFTEGNQKLKLHLVNPLVVETPRESGLHQSTRLCLDQVREALLQHRWQEAAEYMKYFPQILEDTSNFNSQYYKELIWRLNTEILHQHPHSKLEDYNILYEQIKHSGVGCYLLICLEHSFHLLLHGQIKEAKHQLSVAESWRYGKVSIGQVDLVKMIKAYRSVLDYVIWCDSRSTNPSDVTADHLDSEDTSRMDHVLRQALDNLKEILNNSGVWDPFILCCIEMLDVCGDQDEAEKILANYAYDSNYSFNPNAHAYLFNFLKRHGAPQKKLIKVLENLHGLVPSHELMLDYSCLLLMTERKKDLQRALEVVLGMLDFACWGKNLSVWKSLKAIINKIQMQNRDDWKEIILEKMSSRKDWWPSLHYTRFHAIEDSQQNPELMEVKGSLTEILCPDQMVKYSV